ncbi:MAG: hypothetical protein M1308_02575 [Actinobacteria bacterium]|nr:hypothetical protein [Actinomycetota bacterium]
MFVENGKEYYDRSEMITKIEEIVESAKLPRTAVVPVIADKHTGYLNAGSYSGGVVSTDPFRIIFGVKSIEAREVFAEVDEFVTAIPNRLQVDDTYVLSIEAPHGISEVDIAGLTELPSQQVKSPGIKEFPINLECRTCKLIRCGGLLRNIVIADVIGISMDASILDMDRSEVVKLVPIHEAIQRHPDTGRYAMSTLTGKTIGDDWEPKKEYKKLPVKDGKVYVSREDFYKEDMQNVFINAVFPRPNNVVITQDNNGKQFAEVITGGLIMHSNPAIQVPLDKNSQALKNIRQTNQFTIAIPIQKYLDKLLSLRKNPGSIEDIGLTPIHGGQINTPAVKEFPVNMECKVFTIEELPGSDTVLVVAEKCGLITDENLVCDKNYMSLYTQYIYSVFDHGMVEKFSNHNVETVSVKPLPTWGSRYFGGWWGGPEFYQIGFIYWLLELIQSNYISEKEYALIKTWMTWFKNEGWYAPEPLRTTIRERLTKALNIMTHAHRDEAEWNKLHKYLSQFMVGEIRCDR